MARMTPEMEARFASMIDTLRWHRKRKGWTQAQVADMLDVQPNTVAHMETLRQIPNLPRLAEWASLFDLQVGLFAQEEDEEDDFQEQDDLDDDLDRQVDSLIIAPLFPAPRPEDRQRVAA